MGVSLHDFQGGGARRHCFHCIAQDTPHISTLVPSCHYTPLCLEFTSKSPCHWSLVWWNELFHSFHYVLVLHCEGQRQIQCTILGCTVYHDPTTITIHLWPLLQPSCLLGEEQWGVVYAYRLCLLLWYGTVWLIRLALSQLLLPSVHQETIAPLLSLVYS